MDDIRDMMKPVGSCPRCGSKRVVRGQIGTGQAIGFTPRVTSDRARSGTVGFDARDGRACADCGLLWVELSTVELRDSLARGATADVLRWLEERPDRSI